MTWSNAASTLLGELVWGDPDWFLPATVLVCVSLLVLAWAYRNTSSPLWVRIAAGSLKLLGIVALAVCLVEPLFSGTRPRPGANLFLMLTDKSQSLSLHDPNAVQSRGETLKDALVKPSTWRTRLNQDFDVRRYTFASRIDAVGNFEGLTFDGDGSAMVTALEALQRRFQNHPVAGILLFTDGNATDLGSEKIRWDRLPPVYPVVLGEDVPSRDISITQVAVNQTNFEAAPVSVRAEITSHGYQNEDLVISLLDESGETVEEKVMSAAGPGESLAARFQIRPAESGLHFYRLRVAAAADLRWTAEPRDGAEATLANNTRLVMVDRGGGPFRVLYVSGRPNWEFKFLRRAMAEDNEVDLVGLVRIARREPKFNFLSRRGEETNPLFRGFENQDAEEAEKYDQPVVLRLGTRDETELRDGFPKTADRLFEYHAVILDDLDAEFFSRDQMSLLQRFVSIRGGGFLMLGGAESFVGGKFDRTPIGDMLPVYLDRVPPAPADAKYRLKLTREGWLQPWIRVRRTEPEERDRLAQMPNFETVNRIRGIKPGATVLATVQEAGPFRGGGDEYPVLTAQNFGKGRSAALLVGDLWRWGLARDEGQESDLEKAWRQMVRWLIADVPQKVQVDVGRKRSMPGGPVELRVSVYTPEFEPLDNASVDVVVTAPDMSQLTLKAEPLADKSGIYQTTYVPRLPGAYRAQVVAVAADGSEVGRRVAGWTAEPAADEFRVLRPNRKLLAEIAEQSGGELLRIQELDSFVRDLPNRKIPNTQPWVYPLWHQPTVFLFAFLCLTAEWGLRRWKGMP